MSKITRVLTSMIFTVLWVLLPLQAQADDTEIFFSRDFANRISPNVLFALDTSGSMTWASVTGDPNSGSRLSVMKNALTGFLDVAENINVGLMRFNGFAGGGAVVHPIAPIENSLCNGGLCDDISITNRIKNHNDDAEQELSSGAVELNNHELTIGQETSTSPQRRVALKFSGVEIPSGARITSAQLVVTSASDNSDQANFQIFAENSATPTDFTTDPNNLSNRTAIQPPVNWNPVEWTVKQSYTSPDISSLLQNIVNKNDWCGGSDINLFLDGSGTRTIQSSDYDDGDPNTVDDDDSLAPALLVTYDLNNIPNGKGCSIKSIEKNVNADTDDARQRYINGQVDRYVSNYSRFYLFNNSRYHNGFMGLRFSNMAIPKGAKIRKAYLQFVTRTYGSGTNVDVNIRGLTDTNTPTFLNQRYNIGNRNATGASVFWDNVPQVSKGNILQSPDLSAVVQEIVNRGDWNSGHAMGFRINGSGWGNREVEAYDTNSSSAPKLFIEYEDTEIKKVTVRDELLNLTNNMGAAGGTPILDVLYEGAQYLRGGKVDFGTSRGRIYQLNGRWWEGRSRLHRVSHPDSYTGGNPDTPSVCVGEGREEWNNDCRFETIKDDPVYISPMQMECQPTSIVLLSDGAPYSPDERSHITDLTGPTEHCGSGTTNDCTIDFVKWLAATDHVPNIKNEQTIKTHTIAFGDGDGDPDNKDLEYLKDLAKAGGGETFQAVTTEQLRAAFEKIAKIENVNSTTFTSPGKSVNQFNRLTNDNSIYFSLFQPSSGPIWSGNLKKYNLFTKQDKTVEIIDSNEKSAVDPDTGFFFKTAKSEWSLTADGADVEKGGAASKIQVSNNVTLARKVYTYTGAGAAEDEDLTLDSNNFHEDNLAVNHDVMNIDGESQQYRTNLIQWARGVDIKDENDDGDKTDTRLHMGDPMHSGPLVVNYASPNSEEKAYVFVATNEGFLHAIDQASGREKFAFIPQELLSNLDHFYRDDITSNHPYGLDGELSFWSDDPNNNGLVDTGEEALVFLGMRRGGNNYYAFDVSNILKPKLKWVIKGGPDGTPGYEELGQTWSRAEVAEIKYGTNPHKPVLIFGAGYDQNKDDTPNSPTLPRRPDSIGRGIFIADLLTGEKLWSASPISNGSNHTSLPDLKYSIPSSIRVIDINEDGTSDQMYVGDTGGQVWRFDFSLDGSMPLVKGGLLADFGGNDDSEARRFHYPPDLALINHETGPYLSLAIGSGWRAHPLDDEVEDHFFVLHMPITFSAPVGGYGKPSADGTPSSYPYRESDLLDVTHNVNPSSTAIRQHSGWKLSMVDLGEKVLSNSLTVDNKLIFTTYQPDYSTDLCSVAPGAGQIYVVNAFDGSPNLDFADSSGSTKVDDLSEDDRKKHLKTTGIPPSPSALISEEGAPVVIVGPEVIEDIFFKNLTERTWWMEAASEEAQDN